MHTAVRGGRKNALVSATVTAVVSSILLAAGPGPADAPAHLYRALLVRDGALVWDNLWFAGQYPLASYSLLYYLPAAVVGNLPLVLGAAIASTLLFSTVARREFGDAALWPSRAFAVLAAAPMFTGLYAYSVGFAFMLAALAALQRGRRGTTVILAAVTLGASPLAFGFLVLVLMSFALSRRVSPRAAAVAGIPVVALAGLQFAVTRVFRSDGMYPFHTVNLVGLLAVCTAGGLLAARTPRGRPIVLLFTLWAAGSVMLFLIPTPFGDNWTRMSAFVFPVALLTASLARWQPRWLSMLRVRYVPYYRVRPAGCIREALARLSWLVIPQAGRFVVDVPQSLESLWHGATRGARGCDRANEEQASTDATPRAAASATAIASERRSPNVVISSPSSP